MQYRDSFLVKPGKRFSLNSVDPGFKPDRLSHQDAKRQLAANAAKLCELQPILWAERKFSLLIVLQGLDAAGKDGTISHVFGDMNPQGVTVTGFKAPTFEEAEHDFLWRIHPHTPARGYIALFNRSHYEDVLFPRVHGLISKDTYRERYRDICQFEQLLAGNDTRIVKFFLHISPEEQLKRFAARIDDPQRNWKI